MEQRAQKLSASVHKSAAAVLHGKLNEGYATVSQVDISPDLHHATIWVSIFNPSGSTGPEELFLQVEESTKEIRKRIAGDVETRRVPHVTLKLDLRQQKAQSIEDKLR